MDPDPAAAAAVAALEADPFYQSISVACASDPVRRRAVLAEYFSYSIQEGRDLGRCVHLPDPALGIAVWLLPQPGDIQSRAAENKRAFLEATLGPEGCANYHRIVEFMHAKSSALIAADAWYLSIIAVAPAAQGRGLGRQLLAPTLAEADRVSAACFLETFSPRNLSFYERFGFRTIARSAEPTTAAAYAILLRAPR